MPYRVSDTAFCHAVLSVDGCYRGCLFPSGGIQLTTVACTENWEVKGKFPQNLKPMLCQVALKAIIVGEYNDNFFNLMPRLFPYNKFTMTVSAKRHRKFVSHQMLMRLGDIVAEID